MRKWILFFSFINTKDNLLTYLSQKHQVAKGEVLITVTVR